MTTAFTLVDLLAKQGIKSKYFSSWLCGPTYLFYLVIQSICFATHFLTSIPLRQVRLPRKQFFIDGLANLRQAKLLPNAQPLTAHISYCKYCPVLV